MLIRCDRMVSMKYRKLRIAWSVGWGLFCMLLVVLWVRSYWWRDYAHCPLHGDSKFFVKSVSGRLSVAARNLDVDPFGLSLPPDWRIESTSREHIPLYLTYPPQFAAGWDAYGASVTFPHWLAVFVSGGFAAVAWLHLPMQFSLRTLLIVTTLLAMGLGVVVYAAR